VPPIEKKKSRHYCLVTQETINCGRNDRNDISRENKFKIEDGIYSTVKTNVLIPKQIYWFKFKDTEEFHIGTYLYSTYDASQFTGRSLDSKHRRYVFNCIQSTGETKLSITENEFQFLAILPSSEHVRKAGGRKTRRKRRSTSTCETNTKF
jgi:hypothetical protein